MGKQRPWRKKRVKRKEEVLRKKGRSEGQGTQTLKPPLEKAGKTSLLLDSDIHFTEYLKISYRNKMGKAPGSDSHCSVEMHPWDEGWGNRLGALLPSLLTESFNSMPVMEAKKAYIPDCQCSMGAQLRK